MSGARFDDVVARYGGKKFIILLPDVDAPGALIAANRIHEGMKDIQSKTSSVTVSIG
jgi:diguanylate cyclase (GGDEF)-like protein